MTAYIILDIHTKPENLEEMRAFLKENLPAALTFEGCQGVDVIENMDKPGNIVFFERWDSREHYDKYYAWRESIGVLEAFVDMLSQEPEFRFFDTYET